MSHHSDELHAMMDTAAKLITCYETVKCQILKAIIRKSLEGVMYQVNYQVAAAAASYEIEEVV